MIYTKYLKKKLVITIFICSNTYKISLFVAPHTALFLQLILKKGVAAL